MPFGTNPKQALMAVLTVGSVVLLPWLILTWLSRINNAWLF